MSVVNALRTGNGGPTSPTNTTYSGISNYRSDAYQSLRDVSGGKQPPIPPIDGHQVAQMHFEELSEFLASHMAREPAGARSSAREKLTRLTRQQFQELSTDVYDELVRRKNNAQKNEVPIPFLPVRDEFHPKRNQARQKLATLPKTRFKDLSSDVFVELGRRYPELKEDEVPGAPNTPGSVYDDAGSPNPPGVSPVPPPVPQSTYQSNSTGRSSSEQQPPYTSPTSRRRPSHDDHNDRPSVRGSPPTDGPLTDGNPTGSYGFRQQASPEPGPSNVRRPSQDSNSNSSLYGGRRPSQETATYPLNTSRRRPSQDTNNPYQSSRKLSMESSGLSSSQGPSSATAGVIIPNKSTIAEEEIEVPFGRDESPLSSRPGSADGMRISVTSGSTSTHALQQSPDERLSSRSPLDRLGQTQSFAMGGLSALGANLLASPRSEDEETGSDRRGGSEYYDKMSMGRASVASDLSGRGGKVRQSVEDPEKLRREYEFKIATMQSKMASLEGAVADANKSREEDSDRIHQLEEDVTRLQDTLERQTSEVQKLERELEDAIESKDFEVRRADADRQELAKLQERVVELESEQGVSGQDPEAVERLREEMQGLLDTLRELSTRNEEMMADKDADMLLIQTLNGQIKEYKRKYEQAKTELRNNKATSQLFSGPQVPKADTRRMPIADNGVIADIHVTTFQGSIDTLLSVARSDNPTSVLMSMKAVVNAVAAITDDVKVFERRPNRLDISEDTIRHLRERADATLSNLVSAARNHAASFGLSPVSLMDAAASHVSSAVIDLVKLLLLRRSMPGERDTRSPTSPVPMAGNPGYAPNLRSVEEIKAGVLHGRTSSAGSNRGRDDDYGNRNIHEISGFSRQSDRSTSRSPPNLFEGPRATFGGVSDESTMMDGGDDAWEELKPYLEVQSESIVYSIQSLLGAIRRGAQIQELDENLTQIITIVSSIVAVCKDSLPASSISQGTNILRELSENCNKLSEIQSYSEITKATRQVMASSSFGVAKAMKELMKI